jgi:putative peptidoglycan lipid II flippase
VRSPPAALADPLTAPRSAYGLSAVLAACTVASIALGFAQQWLLFTAVGPGSATDAYVAAMSVPQFGVLVVSGTLVNALVPLLAAAEPSERRQTAWTCAQGVAVGFGAFALLFGATARWWLPLVAPGLDEGVRALGARVARLHLAASVATALTGVLWARARAESRFVWAEASGVLGSLVGVAVVAVGVRRWGVLAGAWGAAAKAMVSALLLLPVLGTYHAPRFRARPIAELVRRVRPLLGAAAYAKTDVLLDRFLASLAPAGTLSLYSLAQMLYGSGHLVLSRAVSVPAVTALAQHAREGRWGAFRDVTRRRAGVMLAVTLLALAVLIVAGRPLLDLAFGHGRFAASQVSELRTLLLLLGGLWVAGAVGQVVANSFYAMGDTRTPARIAVVGFTAAILLKLAGFQLAGVAGVAIAASLYYVGNLVWLSLRLGAITPRATAASELNSVSIGR